MQPRLGICVACSISCLLACGGQLSGGSLRSDSGAHGDARAGDAGAPTQADSAAPDSDAPRSDAEAPRDAGPPLPCDARFAFTPVSPGDDADFEARFTDTQGWVYIDLAAQGPGAPRTALQGVDGTGPFTWRWRVSGAGAGELTLRFTRDMGSVVVGTCTLRVAARGGLRDAGLPDAGPRPTDAGPGAPPPTNRFGIGLTSPGNTAQLDLTANLVGPGGWVKLIFDGVGPDRTGPDPSWSNGVRDAYARDLIPVIRFAPAWGDRRVRNQSDSGSNGLRYTRLAAAYAAIVRGLPRRAGWPLYVEVHNEPNLCYEWQCDRGVFPSNRITGDRIALEYASMLRDVAQALLALGDPAVHVANAGLAPGGVRSCECVGNGPEGAFEAGNTSLDFLRDMTRQVPSAFADVDTFASHSYPSSGIGYGFFASYAQSGPGLRYFEMELAAIGRTNLPVLMTETGWTTDAGGTRYCSRDEQARWTRQAFDDVWLTHPSIRAVMPFLLQEPSGFPGFSWVAGDGAPYPVYTTVRQLRCARIPGRC